MSESNSSDEIPEITPQVLHLRDLLKWVRQGRVRVPNFQRDFTWDRPRMLQLFDSIRKQYPIGTLLFWESSTPRPMQSSLGPLQLPELSGGKLLVLDGQQRLTTLSGVLLFDEMATGGLDYQDPGRWDIWYDAAADIFTYFQEAPPSAVRVAELMGTKGLYTAAKNILAGVPEKELAEREVWLARLEAVANAFAAYRVPLVVFATESLKLAVESFTRLNRSGQPMGPDEMFSALTYAADDGNETFKLAKHIDSILEDISRSGFGAIDRVVILRVVLLAAGEDPFRTEWERLATETQENPKRRLMAAIDEARRGIVGAISFLKDEGIFNSRLLPYSMQLVGLAAFWGKIADTPTTAQLTLLRRWLWVTSFTEGFGGLNPSRILLQLKDMREVLPHQAHPEAIHGIDLDSPAHPFPERHDHRSARVRALLCVLVQKPAKTLDGTTISPSEMARKILERGPNALTRVCYRVPNRARTSLKSSPANRIFDINTFTGQAKNWLLQLSMEDRLSMLEAHHISDSAWNALEAGDHALFIEERTRTLINLEREFMLLKGVVPPKSDQPALSAIDVEDEVPLSEDVELDTE